MKEGKKEKTLPRMKLICEIVLSYWVYNRQPETQRDTVKHTERHSETHRETQ